MLPATISASFRMNSSSNRFILIKINNNDIASSPCSVFNGFSHSTLPVIMSQMMMQCLNAWWVKSKEIVDSNLASTAWETNLVWIQRWLAKSRSSIAGCYECGVLCASGHRSILAIKVSSTLKKPCNLILLAAFFLCVVDQSYNKKASIAVSPVKFFTVMLPPCISH